MIPAISVVVGFVNSCFGYQCFSRTDVDIPSVIHPADSFLDLPPQVQVAYIKARSFFDVGYNFGVGCNGDLDEASQESIAKLALACQILSVVSLFCLVVSCMYIYIQLRSRTSVYYSFDRLGSVLEPSSSVEELEEAADKMLSESRWHMYSITCVYATALLNMIFVSCAMASFLSMYTRKGCSSGFCSAFREKIKELSRVVGIANPYFSCNMGLSVAFSIITFTLSAVLAIATVVVRIFFSVDDKQRHVHEFILHLVETCEIKRNEVALNSMQEPNPFSSPIEDSKMIAPLTSKKALSHAVATSGQRLRTCSWVEAMGSTVPPLPDGIVEYDKNILPQGAVFESSVGDYVCPIGEGESKELQNTEYDREGMTSKSQFVEQHEKKVPTKLLQLFLLEEEDREDIQETATMELYRRIRQIEKESMLEFSNPSIIAWKKATSPCHSPLHPFASDELHATSVGIREAGSNSYVVSSAASGQSVPNVVRRGRRKKN